MNLSKKGDYPEWELGLQIIRPEQEFDFDFDILDPTKNLARRPSPSRNCR